METEELLDASMDSIDEQLKQEDIGDPREIYRSEHSNLPSSENFQLSTQDFQFSAEISTKQTNNNTESIKPDTEAQKSQNLDTSQNDREKILSFLTDQEIQQKKRQLLNKLNQKSQTNLTADSSQQQTQTQSSSSSFKTDQTKQKSSISSNNPDNASKKTVKKEKRPISKPPEGPQKSHFIFTESDHFQNMKREQDSYYQKELERIKQEKIRKEVLSKPIPKGKPLDDVLKDKKHEVQSFIKKKQKEMFSKMNEEKKRKDQEKELKRKRIIELREKTKEILKTAVENARAENEMRQFQQQQPQFTEEDMEPGFELDNSSKNKEIFVPRISKTEIVQIQDETQKEEKKKVNPEKKNPFPVQKAEISEEGSQNKEKTQNILFLKEENKKLYEIYTNLLEHKNKLFSQQPQESEKPQSNLDENLNKRKLNIKEIAQQISQHATNLVQKVQHQKKQTENTQNLDYNYNYNKIRNKSDIESLQNSENFESQQQKSSNELENTDEPQDQVVKRKIWENTNQNPTFNETGNTNVVSLFNGNTLSSNSTVNYNTLSKELSNAESFEKEQKMKETHSERPKTPESSALNSNRKSNTPNSAQKKNDAFQLRMLDILEQIALNLRKENQPQSNEDKKTKEIEEKPKLELPQIPENQKVQNSSQIQEENKEIPDHTENKEENVKIEEQEEEIPKIEQKKKIFVKKIQKKPEEKKQKEINKQLTRSIRNLLKEEEVQKEQMLEDMENWIDQCKDIVLSSPKKPAIPQNSQKLQKEPKNDKKKKISAAFDSPKIMRTRDIVRYMNRLNYVQESVNSSLDESRIQEETEKNQEEAEKIVKMPKKTRNPSKKPKKQQEFDPFSIGNILSISKSTKNDEKDENLEKQESKIESPSVLKSESLISSQNFSPIQNPTQNPFAFPGFGQQQQGNPNLNPYYNMFPQFGWNFDPSNPKNNNSAFQYPMYYPNSAENQQNMQNYGNWMYPNMPNFGFNNNIPPVPTETSKENSKAEELQKKLSNLLNEAENQNEMVKEMNDLEKELESVQSYEIIQNLMKMLDEQKKINEENEKKKQEISKNQKKIDNSLETSTISTTNSTISSKKQIEKIVKSVLKRKLSKLQKKDTKIDEITKLPEQEQEQPETAMPPKKSSRYIFDNTFHKLNQALSNKIAALEQKTEVLTKTRIVEEKKTELNQNTLKAIELGTTTSFAQKVLGPPPVPMKMDNDKNTVFLITEMLLKQYVSDTVKSMAPIIQKHQDLKSKE